MVSSASASTAEAVGAFQMPGPLGLEATEAIDAGTSARVAMPAPGRRTAPTSVTDPSLDIDTLQLAAVCYGEASPADLRDEMAGIAHVVVRQARARSKSVAEFLAGATSFAYAGHDGNPRHAALMRAHNSGSWSPGMKTAIAAARDALACCFDDPSNGAYFWDGADIKTNYDRHPKVRRGICFTDPAHNIYGIAERAVPGQAWWRDKAGNKTALRGSWVCVYESTAAHGGTIFWRYTADFMNATGNRPYD